jgi:serine/threonine protein phosphatase PrpC
MANLGDCRAVLCRAGTAVDLTADCKASRPDEIARIADAGLFFVSGGRINGQLQVSRAIGDFSHKGKGIDGRNVVSNEPELTEVSTADRCSWRAYYVHGASLVTVGFTAVKVCSSCYAQ